MTIRRQANDLRLAWLLFGACGFAACAGSDGGPVAPGSLNAAKAAAGPTVTAATPPYGNQGETGKVVSITGSGFATGDQASWQRNGADDPKIHVHSTQFISSTELRATIDIAGDAEIALYDIAIARPGRKGGIGTMLFEVTQAIVIEGSINIRAVTLEGLMTGVGDLGPLFWSPVTGLEVIAPVQTGRGISADGLTIAGGLGEQATTNIGVLWTRNGTGWLQTTLPRDPSATNSAAIAVGSDPMTGAAWVISGREIFKGKANSWRSEPLLWTRTPGGWQRNLLPSTPGDALDQVFWVTDGAVAAGMSGGQAAVWEPNGTGGWSLSTLGSGYVLALNSAGTLAVGAVPVSNGDQAAYWIRSGTTWGGPFGLPVACARAAAVDDSGRIAANICRRSNGGQTTAVVFMPPYSAASAIFLGGLGNSATGGSVEAISRDGAWIVGQAEVRSGPIKKGVYWRIF